MSTSLVILRQQLIAERQDLHLAEKQSILMFPEVVQNMKTLDMEIAQAGVELPVRKYTDEILVKKVATLVKYVCLDYGIVNQNEQTLKYVSTRFMTNIKKYFSDLSLKEIKMAFELAAVGELDQWLPKDKYGKPDAKNYGTFSVEYYTKILKAYRAKKGRVWHNAKKLLPVRKYITSEKEREENRKATIEELYSAFELYRSEQRKPSFEISLFINYLVDAKLIKEIRKPLKSVREKAYRKLVMTNRGKTRRKIIADFYNGVINSTIENEAQALQNNIDIENLFKKLVAEKKHLNQVL